MLRTGGDVRLDIVHTDRGHDAFLLEQKQILASIESFLETARFAMERYSGALSRR